MSVAIRSGDGAAGGGGLNFISLCTGGGGLDLGLELAIPSARGVCLVEREAFAVAHLVQAMRAGLMAPAPVWSNVRTFAGRGWRGLVDGVIGGIPCQPHSLAGKRLGRDDPRDLWGAMRRIIVQSGAWFALIENVEGMVTSGGLDRVRRDLHRLGFAVEIGLFSAAEVGASHERKRVFVLAVRVADAGGYRRREGAQVIQPRPTKPKPSCGCVGLVDAAHGARGLCAGQGPQGSGAPEPGGRGGDLVDPLGRGRDGRAGGPERGPLDGASAEWPGGAGRVFAPGPGDAQHWATVADLHPERLPAVSRYDLFVIALRKAGLGLDGAAGAPSQGGPMEPPAAPGLRAALVSEIAKSTLRRGPDGLAAGLDAARIDELRMLGNGVVPLEAAFAVRTLATRLSRRAPAAARLVRLMEPAA